LIDYSIYYKSKPVREPALSGIGQWDIFISSYNQSERVNIAFDKVNATNKFWLLHTEYDFQSHELPTKGSIFQDAAADSESKFIISFFEKLFLETNTTKETIKFKRLCIDSTGFIRPHFMFLILYLYKIGVTELDILYSEPTRYLDKEKTQFSKGAVIQTRFVEGFGSTANRETSGDLLVIGAGFDHALIAEVAGEKLNARKTKIVGFPSLQPDMYQQSRLRINEAEEAASDQQPYFAPANDPFITANVIRDLVAKLDQERRITNLYLSPLGTKAQTLGFVLYYIGECMDGQRDGGIIFPFSEYYAKETSTGISKSWLYKIEFPLK